LRRSQIFWKMVVLVCGISGSTARAQQLAVPSSSLADEQPTAAWSFLASPTQDPAAPKTPADGKGGSDTKPSGGSTIESPQPKVDAQDETPQQTRRILWVIPNYRAVSTGAHLPPLSTKEKFWLATQDSFDYSSFIFNGILAGIAMANNSEPSFGQGASGYGQYYAHTFADGTIENYLTEAIVPTLTKQDPRYYTLGHGGFLKRTGYSVSRLFLTRTNNGNNTFNISEIAGAGAAAGIGNAYYPPTSSTWVKTYQRWGTQLALDGAGDILKEFWPEINRAIFHNKY
jgi:hypothetical protein